MRGGWAIVTQSILRSRPGGSGRREVLTIPQPYSSEPAFSSRAAYAPLARGRRDGSPYPPGGGAEWRAGRIGAGPAGCGGGGAIRGAGVAGDSGERWPRRDGWAGCRPGGWGDRGRRGRGGGVGLGRRGGRLAPWRRGARSGASCGITRIGTRAIQRFPVRSRGRIEEAQGGRGRRREASRGARSVQEVSKPGGPRLFFRPPIRSNSLTVRRWLGPESNQRVIFTIPVFRGKA